MRKLALCTAVSAALAPGLAFATNGMNMEGYGPVATAMGGASMAYDNGAAAMMNNPATLGLMPEGNRLDAALGRMGPKVTSSAGGQNADSSATSFLMPAVGWVAKRGALSFGAGMFGQGGMGTEYSGDSFMSAGSGKTTRSEVGVMRIMAPIAYEVNQKVTLGGTLDYVRASMDLQMAMSSAQMMDMMPGTVNPAASRTYGTLNGSMVNALGAAMGAGQLTGLNWGYFDFSDSGAFTGKAQGSGFAAKFGGVYRVDSHLSLGASYHSKTQLGDLNATGATVTMNVNTPLASNMSVPVTGNISVKNFQWPETYGAGVAYRMTDALMLVADYKKINWSKVMKDFKMTFTADSTQTGAAAAFGMGGLSMDATLYQNWKDQNVYQLGGAYTLNDKLVIRGGVNIANNPVPDTYMHPLFPAIVKNHFTGGAGYAFSKASSLDASFTIAPQVSATNGQGVTSKHSQFNLQAMYSYRF